MTFLRKLKLSVNVKTSVLLAVTALVVAYVRNHLQYGSHGWSSIGAFLGDWFIHYLAVLLFVVFGGAFASTYAPFFLGKDWPHQELSPSEQTIYVTLLVLAGAIALFVLAHWPASGTYDE